MANIEKKEEALPVQEHEDWSQFSPSRMTMLIDENDPPDMGYLIWTKQSHGPREVYGHSAALRERQIKHIRTGLSWAEWMTPEGKEWITWYMHEYRKHFTVLPCLTFTPPELGVIPQINAPPRHPHDFAVFVSEVLDELGDLFDHIELWNEWNLATDWEATFDPGHETFTTMVTEAARVVHMHGKRVVLGGPSKVNEETLNLVSEFSRRGLRDRVDVYGFHNLRGTWSDQQPPPPLHVQAQKLRTAFGVDKPVWLTEYGFPVADPENRFDLSELERIQVALYAYAVYSCLTGALDRVYWYTYKDEVHESLRFITTGWEDELQFYYGDTAEDGKPRLLARLLCAGGPRQVLLYAAREGLMPLVERASLGRKLPT